MTDLTITIPGGWLPWVWFALGYICGFVSLIALAYIFSPRRRSP